MQIDYTVQIWKEADQYVAHAMPLDVASSGDSLASARAALDEAVRLFIATAAERGTLEEVLEEAGYVREPGQWRSPDWVAVERSTAVLAE